MSGHDMSHVTCLYSVHLIVVTSVELLILNMILSAAEGTYIKTDCKQVSK